MNSLIRASLIHFKSLEAEAIAVLEAYCNNAVAVADHSNLVGEVNDWVVKLSDARDAIDTLENIVSTAQSTPMTQPTDQEG
jgi:hypothetical protein